MVAAALLYTYIANLISREELKIVSSMALNLSKTSLDQLDSVAADLVGQAGQNADVADLLCDLCESHGSRGAIQ